MRAQVPVRGSRRTMLSRESKLFQLHRVVCATGCPGNGRRWICCHCATSSSRVSWLLGFDRALAECGPKIQTTSFQTRPRRTAELVMADVQ